MTHRFTMIFWDGWKPSVILISILEEFGPEIHTIWLCNFFCIFNITEAWAGDYDLDGFLQYQSSDTFCTISMYEQNYWSSRIGYAIYDCLVVSNTWKRDKMYLHCSIKFWRVHLQGVSWCNKGWSACGSIDNWNLSCGNVVCFLHQVLLMEYVIDFILLSVSLFASISVIVFVYLSICLFVYFLICQ